MRWYEHNMTAKIIQAFSMKSHARSVLFLTLSLLLIPLCPRPADAHALTIEWLPLLGLNVGWEDMLLKSDEYKTNNHGLMFTLSGGLALTKIGKMLAGFHLEQDLGFIDLRLKDDAMDALDALQGRHVRRRPWPHAARL